uniref:Ribosomal_L12 domain-containing protein n=1 Tax=Brugia timori TaxID=42155 RepID=A0A0R3QQQ1_9BILA
LKKKLNLSDAPVFSQSFAASGITSAAGKSFSHGVLIFNVENVVFGKFFLFYDGNIFLHFCSLICVVLFSILEEGAKMEKPQPSQKTFFSVKLTKVDDSKKIPLIKEVRAIVEGFNLVQAKKFVEALPATVKEDLSKKEAEELKTKLEKLGATCEIV